MYQKENKMSSNTFMPTQTTELHLSLMGACRKQETGRVTTPKSDSISIQSNPYLLKSFEIIERNSIFQ